MKVFQYIVFVSFSLLMVIVAYLFNWLFAHFVDEDGNLPRYIRWFQPSDNPATGDALWKKEHPEMSNYDLALSYMNRNPAQGFDQVLQANVSMDMQVSTKSAKWFKHGRWIFAGDYWEFSAYTETPHWLQAVGVGRYALIQHGWRIKNILEKYEHKTQGQLISWPIRFNDKAD